MGFSRRIEIAGLPASFSLSKDVRSKILRIRKIKTPLLMVVNFETLRSARERLVSGFKHPDLQQIRGIVKNEEQSPAGRGVDVADEFVPPEHRVDRILGADGATWQGEIADDIGWSAPKTSRVLSDMEAADDINRYEIGRRKVVCLPGEEPESFNTDVHATDASTEGGRPGSGVIRE